MAKVYGLKRATGSMKIVHMRYMMDWKSDLAEKQEEEARRKLKEYWEGEQAKLMQRLVSLDPDGWEAWYDDDMNVPAFGYINERCVLLEARVKELETLREHGATLAETPGKGKK
jgi:hypothetical protein